MELGTKQGGSGYLKYIKLTRSASSGGKVDGADINLSCSSLNMTYNNAGI